MADFPTSVKTFPTLVDGADSVLAAHQNDRGGEVTAVENFLKETPTELTVSSGVLTVTKSRHRVQPQSGTADDIDTISGIPSHTFLILYATDEGTDTLTFKHGTGNLSCFGAADIALSHGFVLCYYDGSVVYVAGGGSAGGAAYWNNPPTVTRVSDTQFTVPDTGNAGNWDSILSKGTVIKWTNSGTKQAMVISSSYASNVVTVNIMGDTFAAGFTNVKYANEKAKVMLWTVAGTIGATGTDVAGHQYAPYDMKVFGTDMRLGTAGSGTTTADINDDGTSMFTTKPSITTTNTSDLNNTADNGIVVLEGSKLTADLDAVAGTAGVDLYLYLFYAPNKNIYLT